MSPAERAELIAELRARAPLCAAGGAVATAEQLLRSASALEEASRLLARDAAREALAPTGVSMLAHSEPPECLAGPAPSPVVAAARRAIDLLDAYAIARAELLRHVERLDDVEARRCLGVIRGRHRFTGPTYGDGLIQQIEQAFDELVERLDGDDALRWQIRSWLVASGIVEPDAWAAELHAMAQAEAEGATAEDDAERAEDGEQAMRDQDAEYRAAIDPRRMW